MSVVALANTVAHERTMMIKHFWKQNYESQLWTNIKSSLHLKFLVVISSTKNQTELHFYPQCNSLTEKLFGNRQQTKTVRPFDPFLEVREQIRTILSVVGENRDFMTASILIPY